MANQGGRRESEEGAVDVRCLVDITTSKIAEKKLTSIFFFCLFFNDTVKHASELNC